MNLDRFCLLFVLSLLPILWLPHAFLSVGMGIAWLFFLVGLVKRAGLTLLLALLIAVSYGQVMNIAYKAEHFPTGKRVELIHILQILKQQDYQTAIAELADGTRLFLAWQTETPLQFDARYQATLYLRPISGRLNHGNFNRQKWYFAQHIHGLGTVKQAQLLSPPTSLRANWLYRVQQQTADLPNQALLLALAFGERAWLSIKAWQGFQQTSTAHLIAISGLHIGLAFGFGFWLAKALQWGLLRWGRLHRAGQSLSWSKWCGLCFAFGYSFLAGFAIPTLRALVAICAVLGCQQLRRYYTPWQLWWRVVVLLLLFDPLALLSESFWLSVLAVAALIFWYQYFPLNRCYDRLFCKKCPKSARLCIALLHLQLGILLVFTPVQLWFFEGISPIAFFANVLIVPLYSFVLVPTILFSLVSDNLLASWTLADWIAQFSLWLITPLSESWLPLSQARQLGVASFCLLGLAGIYGWLWQKSRGYWLVSGMLFGLVNRGSVIVDLGRAPPIAEWLHFDVGQGLAMALVYQASGQKRAVFYDTGASWSARSVAEQEILPYLRREVIEVEAIFVSHDDNDHAGGVSALLKAYPQARLILSGRSRYTGRIAEPCLAGRKWQFGAISIQAVYPEHLAVRATNRDSCVLKVEIGQHRLVFTGDSEIAQERHYAAQIGKVDFLQIGHHGSRTSTSQTLLAQLQPQYALISAGRWNPWHHPHPSVTTRLQAHSIQVFNTAQHGMIRVSFFPTRYQIETARHLYHPWYSAYLGETRKNHSHFAHNRLE